MDGLPTLRKFCSQQAGRAIGEAMVKIIAENREMFQSCLNCANFTEETQWCNYVGQHPPPRVVVYGCGYYRDRDDIPF